MILQRWDFDCLKPLKASITVQQLSFIVAVTSKSGKQTKAFSPFYHRAFNKKKKRFLEPNTFKTTTLIEQRNIMA